MINANRLIYQNLTRATVAILAMLVICSLFIPAVASASIPVGGGYSYEGNFGSKGAKPYLAKFAVDSAGHTYVTDYNSGSVFKISTEGEIIGKVGSVEYGGSPSDVFVDDNDNIYVSYSYSDHPIVKFDMDGVFLQSIGEKGPANNQISSASGISVDNQGSIYVIDAAGTSNASKHKIKKFSSQGDFILSYGVFGLGDANLRYPVSIDTDNSGNVYVGDSSLSKVSVYDTLGQLKYKIDGSGAQNRLNGLTGLSVEGDILYTSHTHGAQIRKFTTAGTFIEEKTNTDIVAMDIDIIADNKIRIINSSKTIITYDHDNNALSEWTPDPNLYDALYDPRLMYTDPEGNSYVYNNEQDSLALKNEYYQYTTISKFNSKREFIENIKITSYYSNGETGESLSIGYASDITISANGDIYILGNISSTGTSFDDGTYAVVKYNQAGGAPVDVITNVYPGDGTYLSAQGFSLDEDNDSIYYSGSITNGESYYVFANYNLRTGDIEYLQKTNTSSGGQDSSINCTSSLMLLDNKLYCPAYYNVTNTEEGTSVVYSIARYDLITGAIEPGVNNYFQSDGHTYSRQVNTIRSDKYGKLYLSGWFADYDDESGEFNESIIVEYRWGDEQLSPVVYCGEGEEDLLRINSSGFGADKYGNIYALDVDKSVGKIYSTAIEVPSKPSSLAFDNQSNILRWDIPLYDGRSPITGYVIEYRRSGSSEWEVIEVNNLTHSKVMSMLDSGVQYDFRVYAINAAGRSLAAEITIFTESQEGLIEVPNTGYDNGY